MKLKLASSYGFCFGVKRAITIAENYTSAATMGPLIHNQDEINRLKDNFKIGLYTTLEEVKDKNIDLVFKEKISNELELQEVLEQKKSLKRQTKERWGE